MYHYHINLKATHPYQSTWYQWLLDIRPIWYYSGVKAEGVSHSISCFSNPLLTWAGLLSIFFVIYHCIREKDPKAWFILIGYATALGPWILLVKRCVFAYHFYPTSFFTMLAIVYEAEKLLKKNEEKAVKFLKLFTIAYVFLFVMFLPATAGFGTTQGYIKLLEWFPTWYFG
jgi:dolichyl-phosphate-mannose--protein O-mannosyl transferase